MKICGMLILLCLVYVRENNSIIYVFIGLKSYICYKNINFNLIFDEWKILVILLEVMKVKVVDLVICFLCLW